MKNSHRIAGVVLLVAVAVLESLATSGHLDPELAVLIMDIAVYALPALGLGAALDVLTIERRRRDPSIPAIRDDIRDVATEAAS